MTVSPSLLERYLTAADRVSALAVGDPSTAAGSETYSVRGDQSQSQHLEGLPLGTVGGLAVRHTFPLDAEYEFRLTLFRTNIEAIRGLEHPHQIEIAIDGQRVFARTVGGDAEAGQKGTITDRSDATDARLTRARAGQGRSARRHGNLRPQDRRELRIGCVRSCAATPAPTIRPDVRTSRRSPSPVRSRPPVRATRRAAGASSRAIRRRPPAHRRARCAQTHPLARSPAARYRRPVTEADLDAAARLLSRRAQEGHVRDRHPARASAPAGQPVVRLPHRGRSGGVAPGHGVPRQRHRARVAALVLSLEQHSRRDAPRRRRRGPAARARGPRGAGPSHARRSARRTRIVENFAGQWLHIRNLQNIAPNTDEFPDFDNDLRDAFARETELFFGSIMREDRNVLDLLRADYTFVNERLAKHYGLPRRLRQPLPPRRRSTDDARRGLLGKGSILMVTSHADRTRRRCAASGFSRTCSARRRRRRRRTCRRSSRRRARQPKTMRERLDVPSRQPGVRRMSPAHGSARVFDGELQRRRRLADARRRRARRRERRAPGWHAVARRGRAAGGAL